MEMEDAALMQVLNALQKACDQDISIMQPAEQWLKSMEATPGFYNILCRIFMSQKFDVNVRWIAVLLFKNGIDRYWRRSAPNAIQENEKVLIRDQLIANFNESTPQIATQVAVVIGKIARLDCPQSWTQLLPVLLHAVREHNQLIQTQSLLTLHHVMKSLASKCIITDRRLFSDMTVEILGYILELWRHHLNQFSVAVDNYCEEDMMTALNYLILTTKVIKKQMIYGIKEIHSSQIAQSFLSDLITKLPWILSLRQNMWGNDKVLVKCEQLILLLIKILHEVLNHQPKSFSPLITPSLQFILQFTFHQTTDSLRFERFVIDSFNFMKSIISCPEFAEKKDATEVNKSAETLKNFFNEGLLTEICHQLVTRYFILKGLDLISWETDPESYAQDEVGDSYKYSLRPCTEVLLLSLLRKFRTIVSLAICDLAKSVEAYTDPGDMTKTLVKEAVYNVVGLAAYDLFDQFDFDRWFSSRLLSELAVQHDNYRVIRRRVIWMIGKWVGVALTVNLRPSLYDAIVPLLRSTEDLVIRLETARTVYAVVDDLGFQTDQFKPYLHSVFGLLFKLLNDVSECENKMTVLRVISMVIERLGHEVTPFLSSLISYLPTLWQDAQEHNLLRCAIVATLVHLVKGLGEASQDMYSFLLPIVQMSTDLNQSLHVYLLDDGLELWLTTLHYASFLSPLMLTVFSNMSSILAHDYEYLKTCLKIIEAYLYLDGERFLNTFSQELLSSFTSLISDLKCEQIYSIYKVVEIIIEKFPVQGGRSFHPILIKILKESMQKEHEYFMMVPLCFAIIARLIIADVGMFWSLVESIVSSPAESKHDYLGSYLDSVFDKFDWIAEKRHRKIIALAVTSLLQYDLEVVYSRIDSALNLCVEMLHDLQDAPSDTPESLNSLLIQNDEIVDETPHEKRKRMVCQQDVCHTLDLKDYVRSQLMSCQSRLGQVTFDGIMNNVDNEVMIQLRHLLSL